MKKNGFTRKALVLALSVSVVLSCFSCSNTSNVSKKEKNHDSQTEIQTETTDAVTEAVTTAETTTAAVTTVTSLTTISAITSTTVTTASITVQTMTQPTKQTAAQPKIQPSTQVQTQPPTQPKTQPPTQPPTQPQTQPPAQPQTEPQTTPQAQPKTIDEIINSMSVREKVGQLIFIRPEALDPNIPASKTSDGSYTTTKLENRMIQRYNQYPVGGFTLFKKNITSPEQLISFTSQLHSLGSVKPLLCIDEEGGLIARIAKHSAFNVPVFPNMQDIANTGDVNQAYNLGNTIGSYLKEYGLDVDFAPVADVNTNPENTVIGVRAFGDNPQVAGQMVSAVLNGLHSNNIMGCIKHFPGHGDTLNDTHSGYAETLKNWDEIKNCEMLPFIEGINAGTDMVMVAHIAAPNVTGNNLPATLSYTLITEKLRNELGYNGVVITDAMEMGAVTQQFNSADAAVLAIKAGVDIVLMPQNFTVAFDALVNAVNCGDISQERLYQSNYRILSLKEKMSY